MLDAASSEAVLSITLIDKSEDPVKHTTADQKKNKLSLKRMQITFTVFVPHYVSCHNLLRRQNVKSVTIARRNSCPFLIA